MSTTPIVVIILTVLALLLCCACLVVGMSFGGLAWIGASVPTSTPDPVRIPEVIRTPVSPQAFETLRVLEDEDIPENNPEDLSQRLKNVTGIPDTFPAPGAPFQVGDQLSFWVSNVDTDENFQVTAVLRYTSEHLSFWIEDGVSYELDSLAALGKAFDEQIYPTNRAFFGSEWTPGIDDDPRLYLLYAGNLGSSLAGYFSSADEIHPLIHPYSNAHEMFVVNADNVDLAEDYIYGTMAHEFQHMIHWYTDRNESTWLNEGFSVLAELLNGYDTGGFDRAYARNTDLQLTTWGDEPGANAPHYGSAFLFTAYFLSRFGEEATRKLVAHPENGMESVDLLLAELGVTDPLSGGAIQADDFFQDWTVANLLQDSGVGDGRYAYAQYTDAPKARTTEKIKTCPTGDLTRTVAQFGADAIEITCKGDYTLSFSGSTEVDLLPRINDSDYTGYALWSNQGDESNMTLTRQFDFTTASTPLTLAYRTWYDLEDGYDFVYVEASLDGESWTILTTPSCSLENATGNSYGCGYTGESSGWVTEQVDLSAYAGQTVLVRFEYVTDAAVNGSGLLLDDIAINETGYRENFESGMDGWAAEGFVRLENRLPQTFRLALVLFGDQTTVQYLTVDDLQAMQTPFTIGGTVKRAVLVVSGMTRFTLQPASYQINIGP